jgi:alkanesulfonate monooxygenase SsuD/methylene tetrahydromethanopterin reductase-like flavin-dependent oxidoreductase (luciferase family)
MTQLAIPVGVNLTTIGVPGAWWRESVQRLESAGYRTAWAWDHFVSRGTLSDPVLECWTTLTAAAIVTRRLRVGSFVTNVMNRHPAVLARMAATVCDIAPGRLELGIGIGGHPAEHKAYGIDFPEPPERAARLEEAVQVLRLLWSGGPVDFDGRFYRLQRAHAFPVPDPLPRIIVGGETPAGARLAARIGDAWTCFADSYEKVVPVFEAELAKAGRSRSAAPVIVGVEMGDELDLPALATEWQGRGADELVLHWVRPRHLETVLAAAERADLL